MIALWIASAISCTAFAERYAYGPTRVQYENKDPRGHAEFKAMLAEHSAVGSANTQQGVQNVLVYTCFVGMVFVGATLGRAKPLHTYHVTGLPRRCRCLSRSSISHAQPNR